MMNRCTQCVMPTTRPDTHFKGGLCSACLTYENRPQVDWDARRQMLIELLEQNRQPGRYDCIVPSSGGKDSTWQVLQLIALGVKPLVVTATTDYLTAVGRHNIDNLARFATTIEVTPDRELRRTLNRAGLEKVGDCCWPEHVSIFTTPFRIAQQMGIPLVFYGENPQNQYGGPPGSEQALELTRRWRSEYGGFLGLRVADFEQEGHDMSDYLMPPEDPPVHAYFLGQFLPWDSDENAKVAIAAGMRHTLPTLANRWPAENLDNALTGLHDHVMYRKYGYGRGCAQISVEIRKGLVLRQTALDWVRQYDGIFPTVYMGVTFTQQREHMRMSEDECIAAITKHTNFDLFATMDGRRPILKEFA